MKPKQSYRIWFTQRSGSSLLCKSLEETGIAGKPQEAFNLGKEEPLVEKYGANTYEAIQQVIWNQGTSENGVFGMKHSWERDRKGRMLAEIKALKNWPASKIIDEETILAGLFPNCQHIFLTRRNKIRQAVSWWKAIKDETWHLQAGQTKQHTEVFYEENYVFPALHHLLKEIILKECATQAYFSQYQIQPLTVVYEDFIADYEGTISRIIDFLGLNSPNLVIQKPFYQKTATALSERWVERFSAELQDGWEDKIYIL